MNYTKETVGRKSSHLNEIIEIAHCAKEGYSKAASLTNNEPLANWFKLSSAQRERFMNQLSSIVDDENAGPPSFLTMLSALHQNWMKIRDLFSSQDEVLFLEECIRGEHAALNFYSQAIVDPKTPQILSQLLSEQRDNTIKDLETLENLRSIFNKEELISK